MKLLIPLSLISLLLISFTFASEDVKTQETKDDAEILKNYPLQYPCSWARSIKVTKLEDDVFQCYQVNEAANITYKSVTTAKDSYQLMIFDEEQYANFLQKRDYRCINEPQCRITDKSMKIGNYPINEEGKTQDFFVVVRNQNFIERAFVDIQIDIQ